MGDAADVERLARELVDELAARGVFRTGAVESAFRGLPRHVFLPGVPVAEVYGREPVVIRRDAAGRAMASASAPDLVALMLELLDLRPGLRVLEIGTATGINAALLARLVGPAGHVTSVEIDADLAAGARDALAATGYADRVTVVTGDGALGAPQGAPYDRIIVTAGAWDLPPAWWAQLASGGRLVVPLRLHASGLTRVLPLDLRRRRGRPRLVATSAVVCGFVPLQGVDAHPEDAVPLGESAVLSVDVADLPDGAALAAALAGRALHRYPGVVLRADDTAEHLDLWLATRPGPAAFGRLTVGRRLRADGIDPAPRWGGAAVYAGGTLAYLVTRRATGGTEVGVAAHGPDAPALAGLVADQLDRWARTRPRQPVVVVRPAGAGGDPADIVRPHTRLRVTWP